jgi:hypothetical protein
MKQRSLVAKGETEDQKRKGGEEKIQKKKKIAHTQRTVFLNFSNVVLSAES